MGDFQLFHFHTGEPILITPEGKGINPTSNLMREGFECHGHCTFEIILSQDIFNFFSFILGANSYFHRKLIRLDIRGY